MIVSRELWNQSLPIFNKVHSDEEDGVGEIEDGIKCSERGRLDAKSIEITIFLPRSIHTYFVVYKGS